MQHGKLFLVKGVATWSTFLSFFKFILSLTVFSSSFFFMSSFPLFAGSAKIELRVGFVPLVSQLPIVVAQSQDAFSYDLLDVSLSKYNSFTSLEAAVRVGAVDAALVPVPIALSMAADDVDIVILGSMSHGGSVLLSQSPGGYQSLRGKIIGVPGLDSNENIRLSDVMERQGLRYGLDYKVISIPFNAVLRDLSSGRIDALYYPEPYGTMALGEGLASVILKQERDLSGGNTTVLVLKEAFLDKEPRSAVKEWLVSLSKACTALTQFSTTDYVEHITAVDFDKEVIEYSLRENMGGIYFGASAPDIDEIRQYLEKVIQLKILYKSIDVEKLVYSDLLDELKSEANIE